MSWIKIAATLPRSPKILLLADALQCSRYAALGLAVDWLTWLDGATEDGKTFLKPQQINELFSVTFFCDTCHNDVTHAVTNVVTALEKIGWIYIDENGLVCASDFDAHNGENAKRRFANAERQRKSRKTRKENLSQKNVTDVTKKCDQRREEKRRGINNNTVCVNTTVDVANAADPRRAQNADQVLTYLASLPLPIDGAEVTDCAYAFFDDMEAVGWTRRGTPIADWRAAARSYANKWAMNNRAAGQRSTPQQKTTFRSEKPKNYDL